jgi:hypothetical protein
VNRRECYFGQVPEEADLNGIQTATENAVAAVATDLLLPEACIIAGLDVVPTIPASLGVQITQGIAYDDGGQRIPLDQTQTPITMPDLDLTEHVPTTLGHSRWVSISLAFDRALWDPRLYVDRLGAPQTVYYRQDEHFAVSVTVGTSAIPPAVKPAPPEGEMILADVELAQGMTSITSGEIDTTRRATEYSGIGGGAGPTGPTGPQGPIGPGGGGDDLSIHTLAIEKPTVPDGDDRWIGVYSTPPDGWEPSPLLPVLRVNTLGRIGRGAHFEDEFLYTTWTAHDTGLPPWYRAATSALDGEIRCNADGGASYAGEALVLVGTPGGPDATAYLRGAQGLMAVNGYHSGRFFAAATLLRGSPVHLTGAFLGLLAGQDPTNPSQGRIGFYVDPGNPTVWSFLARDPGWMADVVVDLHVEHDTAAFNLEFAILDDSHILASVTGHTTMITLPDPLSSAVFCICAYATGNGAGVGWAIDAWEYWSGVARHAMHGPTPTSLHEWMPY